MADRIATVGTDGALPADVTVTTITNGGSSLEVTAGGDITVTSATNAASPVWDARRSYGITDTAAVPVPIVHKGGIETDGMFVALGDKTNRTWESHCFHAWDETGTWRLTMGIDENADPSIGFLQVWRPSPAGFGTVQIGSDYGQQGTLFTQYDIRSFGHLTFSGSHDGRKDTVISQSAGDGSLTLQGGYRGSPNKGSFIQLRGADKTPNPAGTVVSFGCDWRTEEQLAASFLAFNFISDTRNVDLAKLHPTGQLEVTTGDLRITTPKTPATATATGAAGEVCWDADYLYVCTATDTWKRAALSTWH